MNKIFQRTGLAFIVLSSALCSCATLKPVNDFSSASLNGIRKFDDIDYNFQ